MKRFWKRVTIRREDGDDWTVHLDDRPVRTPARALLALPNKALAEAVALEWRAVGDQIHPGAMPLTGLANAAIDRIAPDKQAFAVGLARYAEADLACYRSEWPPQLVDRQVRAWDPLLAWARRRYDVDFSTTSGLIHVPQPAATVERLSHAVAALNPFQLAGLAPLVTIGGGLIAALALFEKAVSPDQAWQAVSVDESWQLEQWGADAEAQAAFDGRHRDFLAGARFLELLED